MRAFLSDPNRAFWLGFGIAAIGLALWVADGNGDSIGLVSFLSRLVHIGAAMIWVGMIWFVNFIQLVALREADATERSALLRHVVPRVAVLFSIASHVVVASGAILVLTTGYMLDRWVFQSAVYIPSARALVLWIGVIAGVAMWALVHGVIRPSLATILDPAERPANVAGARERVLTAARINLVLAIPVTFAMVAAAHLY
jgi:uncharacterized membrane protein